MDIVHFTDHFLIHLSNTMDYKKAILATEFYLKARLIPIIESKYEKIPSDFKKSKSSKTNFKFSK